MKTEAEKHIPKISKEKGSKQLSKQAITIAKKRWKMKAFGNKNGQQTKTLSTKKRQRKMSTNRGK